MQLTEAGETPIRLFGSEPVMCVWEGNGYHRVMWALIGGVRTADDVVGGIVRVRDDQRKLGANVPTFLSNFGTGAIKVERDHSIGRYMSAGMGRKNSSISERKEKYPPACVLRLCKRTRAVTPKNIPLVAVAIELRTIQLLVESSPTPEIPMKGLVLLDNMA